MKPVLAGLFATARFAASMCCSKPQPPAPTDASDEKAAASVPV
jgi:hypothetical protein